MSKGPLIVNDPVYGFISVESELLREVVAHPLFQRLSRIRQLGLAGLVYPGAMHTRWAHSLGAYHLMRQALRALAEKGTFFFDAETEAAEAAMLMHDLGHGPFSHVLENMFVADAHHEDISLLLMQQIDHDLHGRLAMATKLFSGEYAHPVLRQLVCSQLDADRLDYLCRDSFYTGVREGNIGEARIVHMLCATPDGLAVEQKGIYTIENYLMARRLMYWQVYLHKTALAAEQVLRSALLRASELVAAGEPLFCSPALHHFLANRVTLAQLRSQPEVLSLYAQIDDSDVICALGAWVAASDRVLSLLASAFVHRRLFRAEESPVPVSAERVAERQAAIARALSISSDEAAYFVTTRTVEQQMYSATAEGIRILMKNGEVRELADVSAMVGGEMTRADDCKHYLISMRLD